MGPNKPFVTLFRGVSEILGGHLDRSPTAAGPRQDLVARRAENPYDDACPGFAVPLYIANCNHQSSKFMFLN